MVKVKERGYNVEIVPERERKMVKVKEREYKLEIVPERESDRKKRGSLRWR